MDQEITPVVTAESTPAATEPATTPVVEAPKEEGPNPRKLLAAVSRKEREILAKQRELDAAAEDVKLGRELRAVQEALKGKKDVNKVFDLLGLDYLALSELVANDDHGREPTEEERISSVVQVRLDKIAETEKATKEAEKAAAEAHEIKLLNESKNRYRGALASLATKDAAKYPTTAALGEHGIDLAYSIMETALEKNHVVPIEECLSLAEKHLASKLSPTAAEDNQDSTAEPVERTLKTVRSRSITNSQTAQVNAPRTIARTESERLDDVARRLQEAGFI